MGLHLIDTLLSRWEELFLLTLGDERGAFESGLQDVYVSLEQQRNTLPTNSECERAFFKAFLYVASKSPPLFKGVEHVIQQFQRHLEDEQQCEQQRVHLSEQGVSTHPVTGNPLTQDEIEWLYDACGYWSQLPVNLVREHLDLIKKSAVKFQLPARIDPDLEFDDLMSVAREALFVAAERMYLAPKPQFRAYASQVIKDAIKKHQNSRYPMPFGKRRKLESLNEARSKWGIHGKDAATVDDLAKHLGYHVDEVVDLLEIEATWGDGSAVDYGDRMEELQIPDQTPGALEQLIDHETDVSMTQGMTTLTAMERNVILHIYYKDLSFRETAAVLGVSLSVVKKHHRQAMLRLKSTIEGSAAEASRYS